MQRPLLSTLSFASLSAMLLLVACTDGTISRFGYGPNAEPGDEGPGGVGGSNSGGSGGSGGSENPGGSGSTGGSGTGASDGSDNPGPQCTGTETQCGTTCCPNKTHVCNGSVCEPSAEPCHYGTTCATGKVCNSVGEC